MLNGRRAKSAHVVKIADEIVLRRRDRETTARVVDVPASPNVSRRDARQLIEVVGERELEPLDN